MEISSKTEMPEKFPNNNADRIPEKGTPKEIVFELNCNLSLYLFRRRRIN